MNLTPHVVTLGTAGGPRWWRQADGGQRAGIATAVVVGESVYLVDCGQGAGAQLSKAGIEMSRLRGIFLTHLHSDHVIDLAALTVFGFMNLKKPDRAPVPIYGPGDRRLLPPVSPRAEADPVLPFPENPTPGTSAMFDHLMQAHGTDLADRMLDSLRPSPYRFFSPVDITVPAKTGFHPNDNPTPAGMEPFEIFRDDLVTVTATLVQHPPVAPAFAFRFDTEAGSVTISGDTAPCENLVRLAAGTGLLLHEAIDFAAIERAYVGEDPATVAATMDHHRKSHTSPQEAGELARRAGAQRLALHHLVPGNAAPEIWQAARSSYPGELLVPDDLDAISFATAAMASPMAF